MKLLVYGGRNYRDWVRLESVLDEYYNKYGKRLFIIEGGAPGADNLAKQWRRKKGIHGATVDALWDFYDKAAGRIRNQAMLALEPDEGLQFPGGKGTADMRNRLDAAGITVREVK